MAPVVGHRRPLRVPQLRAAVPHRDVHAEPLDVRDGRHQRLRPAGRRRRAVPRHRPVRRDRRVHRRPDGRRDRRGQRRRPLRPVDVPRPARQPGVRRVGAARPVPWGRHAGRVRAVRDDGDGDVQPSRSGRHRHARPPVAARRSPRRRPDDAEVAAGATGEIVVRGTTVMCGYWNRPELNAERRRGGWHHTNDLGRYEADGTFTFIGPKARMLKSGAENIYPSKWRIA